MTCIFLTVLSAAVFLYIGLHRADIETDILKTLPTTDPVVADAGKVFAGHPMNDQIVIDVGIDRDEPDTLADAGEWLEKQLLSSGLFQTVGTGGTQYLIPELINHVIRNLPILFTTHELDTAVQPLLEPGVVKRRLEDNLRQLSGMEGVGFAGFIESDPLGLRNIVLAKLAHLAPGENVTLYRGHLLSDDRTHLLITASPVGSGMDTDVSINIVRLIDDLSVRLNRAYEKKGVRFVLTPVGAYRAALDNRSAIEHDVKNAIFLASLGIACLLLVSFPRPLVGLMSFVPAVFGTITAFFICSLLNQPISILAIGFGGSIISITVDHGIAYLLFLDRPHATKGRDAAKEVRAVGLLATLTTVGAFLTLSFSGFPVLVQIGRFAALGIAASFGFVHTLFPLMLSEMPPAKRKKQAPLQRIADKIALTGGRYKAYAACGLALVMLCFARPEFHADLNSMNSVSDETLRAEQLVTQVWGDIFNNSYMISRAENAEALQRNGDRLSEIIEAEMASGILDSAFVPSMIFPGDDRGRRNFEAWKRFWQDNDGTAFVSRMQQIAMDTGFSREAFTPFYNNIVEQEYRGTAIPEKFYGLLGIAGAPDTSELVMFSTLAPGHAYHASDFFDRIHSTGMAHMFDPTLFTDRLGELLAHTFIKMLLIIGVSVIVLLVPFFMDLRLTLVALLPVVFAFVCTLGTMRLIGHPLDIPSLMLSIVIMGMGVDYSLYMVRSAQRYADSTSPFQGHIRMTVLLAAVSTIIGFVALSLSEHSLLRSMGITSLLGIGYALIGTFTLLPPMLDHFFTARGHMATQTVIPGSRQHVRQVMRRYQSMETHPRMFAWFKMKMDPMFPELAEFVDSPKVIVDIGSGHAVPMAWLLEVFPDARVFGIEPDIERVRVASRAIGDRGNVVQGRAPDIPSSPLPADAAFMLDMAHYLTDEELVRVLTRLREKLKEGGVLVIRVTIPSKMPVPWFRRIEEIRLRINKKKPYYRSADEIHKAILSAGFQVDIVKPAGSGREETWFVGRAVKHDQATVGR